MDTHVNAGLDLEKLIATAPTTAHKIAFQMLAQAAKGGAIEIRHIQEPADMSEIHAKLAELAARVDAEQMPVAIPADYDDSALRRQLDQLVAAHRDMNEQLAKLRQENVRLRHDLMAHDHETIRNVA